MDEIARIAHDYFERYHSHALMLIDDQISRAVGQSQWCDVLKWHRVRHRVRRLEMVYAAGRPNRLAH